MPGTTALGKRTPGNRPDDARYASVPTAVPTTARRVIVDTDMQTDPGDMGALRVAMYYEKAGFLDILALVVDTNTPTSAPLVDTFCRNAGRVYQIGQVSATYADLTNTGSWHQTVLAAAPPRFGGQDSSQYADGVSMYRSVLANAAAPVDILAIGPLTAIYGLMQSAGDAISSLTGMQLIQAKVGQLWIMGGQYPSGTEHNFSASAKSVTSAWYVCANWPTTVPITFLGFEVGNTVVAHTNLLNDAPANDLFLNALTSYNGASNKGPELGRPAWDELLIQLGALGPSGAGYTTVTGTNVTNNTTGANTFTAGAGGPHRYVVKALTDQQYADSLNAINVVGQEPVPSGARWRSSIAGSSVPVLKATAAPSSPQGLPVLARMKATDAPRYGGVVDGSLVQWLPSHGGPAGPSWVSASGSQQPTYRASIGGRTCLEFAGGQVLVSGIPLAHPSGLTVIARVRWATLPTTANQAIAAADNGTRIWQFKTNTASAMQAINFTGGTGRTDVSAASLVANTWHLVAMRYDATSLEALIDAATNGVTTTTAANTASLAVTIGARDPSLSEPMTGYIADVKICSGKATDAQLSLLSADM